MKNTNLTLIDYFRIKDWFHYLGYVLLGSLLANSFNIFNFFAAASILAYAYSLNDYYDKKLNKKYFIIPFFLYIAILPFLSIFSILISISFLILFTIYSWPKVWLEGKPILSTLTNSIGFTLIFILPINSIKMILDYCPLVLLIFTLNTAAQLLHEIVDSKEDKKIKKITTTVRFGAKTALVLFKLCLLSAMIISALIFSKFPLISLSSAIFSLLFIPVTTINKKIRKKFRILGIIFGAIYIIEILQTYMK
jgi:4-hydroxybenzoate polyprenyltransferase